MPVALLLAATLALTPGPRYDVPAGFTRCASATAWHGFFKWASARDTSCTRASRFMRDYAEAAEDAESMPRRVDGYACRIHFWRDEDDQVYASRHVCTRGDVVIRFYGMV